MKIGIIGTGSMGKNHVRVVNSINEFELVSIMDTDEKSLKELSKSFSKKKRSCIRRRTS